MFHIWCSQIYRIKTKQNRRNAIGKLHYKPFLKLVKDQNDTIIFQSVQRELLSFEVQSTRCSNILCIGTPSILHLVMLKSNKQNISCSESFFFSTLLPYDPMTKSRIKVRFFFI